MSSRNLRRHYCRTLTVLRNRRGWPVVDSAERKALFIKWVFCPAWWPTWRPFGVWRHPQRVAWCRVWNLSRRSRGWSWRKHRGVTCPLTQYWVTPSRLLRKVLKQMFSCYFSQAGHILLLYQDDTSGTYPYIAIWLNCTLINRQLILIWDISI